MRAEDSGRGRDSSLIPCAQSLFEFEFEFEFEFKFEFELLWSLEGNTELGAAAPFAFPSSRSAFRSLLPPLFPLSESAGV